MTVKKIFIVVIVAAVAVLMIYLNHEKLLKWQTVTILCAAIAAPFRSLLGFLRGDQEMEKIDLKHDEARVAHDEFRKKVDGQVAHIEKRIEQIQKNIEGIGQKINQLEEKKSHIQERIDSMSIEERQKALQDAFG